MKLWNFSTRKIQIERARIANLVSNLGLMEPYLKTGRGVVGLGLKTGGIVGHKISAYGSIAQGY